jgi:hypothetical protein
MNAGESGPIRRRLRAPPEDGGTLIEPPPPEAGALLAHNIDLRRAARCEVAGRTLADLAGQARAELLDAAREATAQYRDVPAPPPDGPLLLAGHQPQLFHAGVWFKNFVLGGLATAQRGTGVNLVIDSDSLRTPSLRVPGGSVQEPTAHAIPFDAPGPEIPFEERTILDRPLFDSFAGRASEQLRPLVTDPLLQEFWPVARRRSRETDNLGACLAQSRHVLEGMWGLSTLELPQSRVCQLPAFQWFAAHLLVELPRLHDVYNRSLWEYRRVHRVRSRNHPAPDLAAEDDWLEAPFWIWTQEDPRRRRLFVRREPGRLLLSNRGRVEIELPAGDAARTAAALAELPAQRIKLRTRALITTLWARLALGDVFLHGIGGAKYDQLTDLILQRFFHVPPPAFLTVTATLRLPIPRPRVNDNDLRQVQSELRELEFHPERWLDRHSGEVPAADRQRVDELRRVKAHWIAAPQTRDNARQRCREIRTANQQLAAWTQRLRSAVLARRETLERQWRAEAILASREYAFCLFPARTLRNFLLEFHSALTYPKAT